MSGRDRGPWWLADVLDATGNGPSETQSSTLDPVSPRLRITVVPRHPASASLMLRVLSSNGVIDVAGE